jgi:MFS transporter, ACDE family, multidrug resistance protein
MVSRNIPEWVRHAPAPGVRGFATLSGCEAVARGMLISVFPLAMYQALGDARLVSAVYFAVGLASLLVSLLVPWINRLVPRRWVYVASCLTYVAGALAATQGGGLTVPALFMITAGTAAIFVCHNAYVLDYIARVELGRNETLKLFYSAAGWTVGPVLGVFLWSWWAPAPFLISAAAEIAMLGVFLAMRLGNGRLITRARVPATNPLAYIGRFMAQPRLLAGWAFAVIRSCGWWVYVVYLPIFAVERGLGDTVGGAALSASNAMLFLSPVMLRWTKGRPLRAAVRTGFAAAALFFALSAPLAIVPVLAIASLAAGSFFLVLLDLVGGLPFLMAVKPSERTEMSAVYASFRDVSGVATPGAAWLVLLLLPVEGVFLAAGAALFGAFLIAGSLHPRIGASADGPSARGRAMGSG